MSWWERVKETFRGEAADVEDHMRAVGRSLDEELARREKKLNATPDEGLDIVLEEAEASNQRLDELTDELAPSAEQPDQTPERERARLLDRTDVDDSPQIDTVMDWLTVEAPQPTDPLVGRFDHCVWIEEDLDTVVTDEQLQAVAHSVAEHPLIEEVLYEDRDVMYVRASTLHHEDVELLVAEALARHAAPEASDEPGS